MANFEAAYADSPSAPTKPSIEEMFTIEPRPAARIGAMADLTPSQVPLRFTLITRSNSSTAISAIRRNFRIPALLTRMSNLPCGRTRSRSRGPNPLGR